MATRNLYVSAKNAQVWELAEEFAEANDMSVSQVVAIALRTFIDIQTGHAARVREAMEHIMARNAEIMKSLEKLD